MKKEIVFALFFVIIMSSSLVLAVEPYKEGDVNKTLGNLGKTVDKFDTYAEKQITLPERLQKPAEILLKLEATLPVSLLITTLAVLLIFLLAFTDIMRSFGPFSERTSILVGFILVILLSVTGTIKNISFYLFNIGKKFQFLQNSEAGTLGFVVVLVLAIGLLAHSLLKRFRRLKEKQEAEEEGFSMGLALGTINSIKKAFSWMGGAAEEKGPRASKWEKIIPSPKGLSGPTIPDAPKRIVPDTPPKSRSIKGEKFIPRK